MALIQSEQYCWHEKVGWKASDYFEDPQVIALCEAIEENDIAEIDRLIEAGADVNAKGKGNMTPLLWAFPDNQIKRFKHLIKRGANPNVIFESDFGVPSGFHAGDSVTHMSARTQFPGYLEAVMESGGDPNLIDQRRNRTLLHAVITAGVPDVKQRVQILIDNGADLNALDSSGHPPVRMAVMWFRQFDVALKLLKAGATPSIYRPRSNSKLVHAVESAGQEVETMSDSQRKSFIALEAWLREAGEDLKAARMDNARWSEWIRTLAPSEYRKRIDREVAERMAREKAAVKSEEPVGSTPEADAAEQE
ncbi:ankyrin repeat domain-containing protein [Fuerstiella marisgermanici]|uniref:ankyrin repeat domain-containing protein n=1 Tax=Fuerstiella marisgermanici TaxID=1891926 RepID=UPI0013148B3F|nr:ankyrin repeat domain-containing protein [Fuerstiella marisgermanici]